MGAAVLALYAIECAALVPRDAYLFSRGPFGPFRVRRAADAYALRTRSLVFLSPIPGIGEAFVCRVWTSTTSTPAPRDDPLGAGRPGPHPDSASRFPALQALDPRARRAAIDAALSSRLGVPAVEARLREVRRAATPARAVGLALFGLIFVAGPVLHATGFLIAWSIPLLVGGLALHAAAVGAALRADRALDGGGKGSGWGEGLKLALSPLSSMRGGERVLLRGLDRFEPVAVAWVLTDSAQFEQVARESLDRLDAAIASGAFAPDVANRYRAMLGRLLKRAGIRPGQLELPAESRDRTTRSFCPRCRAEYVVESGDCVECEVALRPLHGHVAEAHRDLLRRMDRRRRRGRRA